MSAMFVTLAKQALRHIAVCQCYVQQPYVLEDVYDVPSSSLAVAAHNGICADNGAREILLSFKHDASASLLNLSMQYGDV